MGQKSHKIASPYDPSKKMPHTDPPLYVELIVKNWIGNMIYGRSLRFCLMGLRLGEQLLADVDCSVRLAQKDIARHISKQTITVLAISTFFIRYAKGRCNMYIPSIHTSGILRVNVGVS